MTGELPALVSTEWLALRLAEPGIRVLDGSWYLPSSGRDPAREYAEGHIPGALFFDLDAASDQTSSLPHMLPTAESFAARMSHLGLNQLDDIVVYDGSGVNLSAPRVWWMLQTFGHARSAVLDGGLEKWRREGRPIQSGVVQLPPGQFSASLRESSIRDFGSVLRNIESRAEQLVDVRSRGRFLGIEPEPRAGLRGGHVPGSWNVPFTELVNADGTMLETAALRSRLENAGLDLHRPVIATCGSATSACALVLGLHLLGVEAAVYDGAWSEWGGRPDSPVET